VLQHVAACCTFKLEVSISKEPYKRLVGSLKLEVSISKEPYKRDLYSPKRLLYVCVWQ